MESVKPKHPRDEPITSRMRTNVLLKSLSTREPSFSELPISPARLSLTSIPTPYHTSHSPPSPSPPPPPSPIKLHNPQTSHRCISSMLKKDGRILSITVSGGLVYTGSESNIIRIWKLPEFTEYGILKTKTTGIVRAMAVANDHLFAAYGDSKIRVWRRSWNGLPTHVRYSTIPRISNLLRNYVARRDSKMKHPGAVTSLAINASDDLLYSASLEKSVKVWRISDLKWIETIQGHDGAINAIIAGVDGVLYTASDDATIRVWRRNFCTGDRPHALTVILSAKCSPVKALALTGDNTVLYGGCSDGYVHYWHKGCLSGQMKYGGALLGHCQAVMCLSSVESYVISGSADATCRVWLKEESGDHRCLAVLEGHRGPVRCVAGFSGRLSEHGKDEGCSVCTGSLDGVIKVWRVTNFGDQGEKSAQCSQEYFKV